MVRINGRPATVSVLHEIGELLINIHGQHDNQILLRPEKHIDILDALGETADALKAYQVKYRELLTVHKMLTSLTANEAERAKKLICWNIR